MTANEAGGWAAVVFMVAMVGVLFPNREVRDEMREEIVRVTLAEEIPQEVASARMEEIKAEAEYLHAQGRYDGAAYFSHLKELKRLALYSRQGEHFGVDGAFFGTGRTRQWCFQFFNDKLEEVRAGHTAQLHALLDGDEEFKELEAFVPYEVKWHWGSLFAHLLAVYPLTVLLALFYHIGVLAFRKRSVLAELVAPDRLARASLFWPIHFWYETREPREQFKRASYAVAYSLAAALCFLPGSVRGQSGKDAGKQRTNTSLQLDLRNTHFTGEGPPDPNLFARATLNRGPLVVESITTANPELETWNSELGVGAALVNDPRTRINILGIASRNHLDSRRIMLGLQAFIPWKRGVIAVPVIRLERELETGKETFAFATNPTVRACLSGWCSRLSIAPDFSVRKTEGQQALWNTGAGVRLNYWKKDQIEVGVLRNSLGQTQVRGRVILNFAF